MKRSLIVIARLFCWLVIINTMQCQKTTPNADTEIDQISDTLLITENDISNFELVEYALSDQARRITENWTKFNELSAHIENLKKGQLTFFKDDKVVMQGLLTDLISEIPEKINKPSILARLVVLETSMNKLDEAANIRSTDKETILNHIKDLLSSHTNFIYQINKEIERDAQVIARPTSN